MKAIHCGLLLVSVAASSLWAQPYSIDWYTIDGGGGQSSGGVYTLNGTVGQPDATLTVMSGGAYTLEGGFWPGMVATSSGGEAPALAIQISGGQVVISWAPATPGFILEQTDSLVSPTSAWEASQPGTPPVWLPIEGTARFYRLRRP